MVGRHVAVSVACAADRGAAFGLAVYGVYNLTNKATLPGYSWKMVAVDTVWGGGPVHDIGLPLCGRAPCGNAAV